MPERMIAELCSPTLCGLKSAGLINCEYDTKDNLIHQVIEFNLRLASKGIYCMILSFLCKNHALVYFFRPNLLQKDLQDPNTRTLIESLGYQPDDLGFCLNHLKERLSSYKEFPHEIGCFLGYPYDDVKGFMNHEKSQYCGIWQVYKNVEETKKLFDLYDACTKRCIHDFEQGIPLEQLAA